MLLSLYPLLSESESFTLIIECDLTSGCEISTYPSVHTVLEPNAVVQPKIEMTYGSLVSTNDEAEITSDILAHGTLTIVIDNEIVISSDITATQQSEARISELISLTSGISTFGEVLTAISEVLNIEDSFSVQLLSGVNCKTQIGTYADIPALLSTGISVNETVSLEDVIRAFQYFKVRNWTLSQKNIPFTKIERAIHFSMSERKTLMNKKERVKQWSSVNRNILAWKLKSA